MNWDQVSTHLSALGYEGESMPILVLFPPKVGGGACVHLRNWNHEQVERELSKQSRADYSIGFIPNPGGTKLSEITECLALFYEDDNPDSTLEEKARQWETAGLPEPSLQVWTGGKSVHNYWMLTKPCSKAAFREAQKRLFAHIKRKSLKPVLMTH